MKQQRFLLDINVLIALGIYDHEFHNRVSLWVSAFRAKAIPEFATCSLTELSFVRLLARVPQYGFDVMEARKLLTGIKSSGLATFTFLTDNHNISNLPLWVRTHSQLTDGHLVELARSQGFQLATLDKRIPGAILIP